MYMGLWLLKYKGFEFYIANFLYADEGSENKWNERSENKWNEKKISYHLYLEIRRERENKIENYFLSYVCVAKRNKMERIVYFFT